MTKALLRLGQNDPDPKDEDAGDGGSEIAARNCWPQCEAKKKGKGGGC